MIDECCEVQNCMRPGYMCPSCAQCFCWQHLQHSTCKACHRLLVERSFESEVMYEEDVQCARAMHPLDAAEFDITGS